MRAIVRTKYGTPDVLQIKEIDKPVPKDKEVLIKVFATTINRTDCAVVSGKPFIMRFFTGLWKPRLASPGTDFAGEIEAVGKAVTHFKVGDRVWGFDDNGLGSQTSYFTLAADKAILLIPELVTYEQAAASAEAAHYAYNFINKVNIKSGTRVMLNGASGAIGSAALQFLKNRGAKVTATCREQHVDTIKALGADRVIDYEKEDFTKDQERYHFVFDAVGKSTFGKCKRLLLPGGIYISSELGPGAQNPFLALITPMLGGKKVIFPVPTDIKGSLQFIKNLLEQGQFSPLLDEHSYKMENIADGYRYVASGQKVGNVLLKVALD